MTRPSPEEKLFHSWGPKRLELADAMTDALGLFYAGDIRQERRQRAERAEEKRKLLVKMKADINRLALSGECRTAFENARLAARKEVAGAPPGVTTTVIWDGSARKVEALKRWFRKLGIDPDGGTRGLRAALVRAVLARDPKFPLSASEWAHFAISRSIDRGPMNDTSRVRWREAIKRARSR